MCAVDPYSKEHTTIPDNESSGGGIPSKIPSSKEALI